MITMTRQLSRFVVVMIVTVIISLSKTGWADNDRLVVVAHPDYQESITRKDLYRLYFGKRTSQAGGTQLIPILNDGDEELLQHFSSTMLKRSSQQLRSYWARQLFTGKGTPPVRVKNSIDLKELIAANPKFIGYLWESDLDASVRVVLSAAE